MKKLKDFPILQRLVDIYRKINQAEKKDDLIEYIEEDMVLNYAEYKGAPFVRIYLFSNRQLQGSVGAEEYTKCYDKGKEIILLNVYKENSEIEYELFNYQDYPFQEELKKNYDEEADLNYRFENDVNYEYKREVLKRVQDVVAEYE